MGMRLDIVECEQLHTAGIGVHERSRISLEYQETGQRWVLRAEECGGATEQLGHYVGFVSVDEPFLLVINVQKIRRNVLHRIVFAKRLVRYEMYRCNSTYELLIDLHWTEEQGSSARPLHRCRGLFRGRFGTLDEKLWTPAGEPYRGNVKPIFRSRSGEEESIPGYILDGVFRVTEGVCCVNCKHSHFFDATPLTIPPRTKPAKHTTRIPAEITPVAPALALPAPAPTSVAAPASPRKQKKKKRPAAQPTPASPAITDAIEAEDTAEAASETNSAPTQPV
jgi:hypothetical protein